MEYYLVRAKFGHVGRNRYIVKAIPVYCENGREAAYRVRWMSRVKHHAKDAIIDVIKIDLEQYLAQIEINKNDAYFSVRSKQEQNRLCQDISEHIQFNKIPNNREYKNNRKEKINFKMKKNKIIINDTLHLTQFYEDLMFIEEEVM